MHPHLIHNKKTTDLQLQQRQTGIAVKSAVLALLGHIVLEHGGGLGVVSVQAVEDGVDVSRTRLALVEGGDHGGSGGGGMMLMMDGVESLCVFLWAAGFSEPTSTSGYLVENRDTSTTANSGQRHAYHTSISKIHPTPCTRTVHQSPITPNHSNPADAPVYPSVICPSSRSNMNRRHAVSMQ